jgi:mannosyltransferase
MGVLLMDLNKYKYVLLLLAITVIGFILRFYNLGAASLWLDEASTVTFATAGSFWDILNLTITTEPNPPLFNWIEYIMITLFGNNEFILRFIPALVSVLTIPVVYFIGKEFIDEKGGLIAAVTFSISPFLILYAQEARPYSLMFFFLALTLLFYLRTTEDTKYWILFAIAGSLAFYTHYYSIIFIGALLLFTLVMYKFKYIKGLITSSVILGLTIIPLAIISIPVILQSKSAGATFGYQGISIIYETFIQLTGFNIFVAGIMLLLFSYGIYMLYKEDKNRSIFLLWMLTSSFVITFFLSYKIPIVPRYLIFLELIIVLGIAYSYKLLEHLTQNKNSFYIIMLIMIFFSVPILALTSSQKDDWRGFSNSLSSITQTGDSIIVVPAYIVQPLNYYYSNTTDGTLLYEASNVSTLQSLKTNHSYYIMTLDIQSADPSGKSYEWIHNNTRMIYMKDNIYLYKPYF